MAIGHDNRRVIISYEGRSVTGTYGISGKIITVVTAKGGSKTAQLGESPAETLAKMMLKELAQEGKA